MHFGIDYGSKLAGTTVITFNIKNTLFQKSSTKKEDADAMIRQAVIELMPSSVFIDAPLSLPKAYFGKGEDYFYREADKALKAMSPMFLGGLTARAIQLTKFINSLEVEVLETYPGALTRSIPELKKCYNKKDKVTIPLVLEQIESLLGHIKIENAPVNYHQVDSILAWYSGYRHQKGEAFKVGNMEEGIIIY